MARKQLSFDRLALIGIENGLILTLLHLRDVARVVDGAGLVFEMIRVEDIENDEGVTLELIESIYVLGLDEGMLLELLEGTDDIDDDVLLKTLEDIEENVLLEDAEILRL